MASPSGHEDIRAWLARFSRAVRERDFEAGKRLFSQTVLGFGTVAERAETLDELLARQWSHVWPRTRGFDFDADSVRIFADGDVACVAAQWVSWRDLVAGDDRARHGRVTLVLHREGGEWKAVHTHFSMRPDGSGEIPDA
jgi:ketosteroid isomerase-like protein